MQQSSPIVLAGMVLTACLLSATDGRLYRIVRPSSYYDSWRQKRQSHPHATQVRIPEVAFADTVSLTTSDEGVLDKTPLVVDQTPLVQQQQQSPLVQQQQTPLVQHTTSQQQAPLVLADYLTPPPAADQASTQPQEGKWDLGFDANEVLVPPASQAKSYDTLKLFTLLPSSGATPDSDPGFENAVQSILEQAAADNSAAGSNSHEELVAVLPVGTVRRPPYQEQTGPVYTYVKTDKHGHFKWGVRHGQ